MDKNRDELPRESTNLLALSSSSLISKVFDASIFAATANGGAKPSRRGSLQASSSDGFTPSNAPERRTSLSGGSAPARRGSLGSGDGNNSAQASVSAQFKEQLANLMDKIYSTSPHYIRCLKPNDENIPDSFDRLRTTEQLRYGGVLEAVRVARSGFPVRLSHVDFYSRYRPLANPFHSLTRELPRILSGDESDSPKIMCEKLMEALWEDAQPSSMKRRTPSMTKLTDVSEWKGRESISRDSIQLGLTKVFLRKSGNNRCLLLF